MTMIVTFLGEEYIMQIGDQRVSLNQEIFDDRFIKNLLVNFSDGITSIGFCGRAYTEKIPTDEWLAKILIGDRYTEKGVIRIGGKNNVHSMRIHDFIKQVTNRLNNIHTSHTQIIEIIVAGWQFIKNNKKYIIWKISHKHGKYHMELLTRRFVLFNDRIFINPNHNIDTPTGYKSYLSESLLKPKLISEDIFLNTENLILDTIRKKSSQIPSVGPDCIGITIPKSENTPIYIKHLPLNKITLKLKFNESIEIKSQVSYSPWIIGHNIYKKPSIYIGKESITLSGREVITDSVTPKDNILAAIKDLPRKQWNK